MKRIFLALYLAFLFVPQSGFTQIQGIENAKRIWSELSNKRSTYYLKKMDDNKSSTLGGQILYYYSGKDLKIIHANYYGELGRSSYQYFYEGSDLVLVYKMEYKYNAPIGMNDPELGSFDDTKTKMEDSRFYFKDGSLISWKNPYEDAFKATSKEFKEEGEKLLIASNNLREQF